MGTSFDMDALRTLVTGADLGSFARAATRLGRSQSAISMQIKKLEQQAGQKLFRKNGRHLERTEAGDALLAYARRIISLNDEAATSVGAITAVATVRLAMPQDFANDVLPAVCKQFGRKWPSVHIEARAGRNYSIAADIAAGHLDVAIAFADPDAAGGETIARLPLRWIAQTKPTFRARGGVLPLVLFDHPCLFRQAAMDTLDGAGIDWRLALTTPSLPGVWSAVRAGVGVAVRTAYGMPTGLCDAGKALSLPTLPPIDVRILSGVELSPAAADLHAILRSVLEAEVKTGRRGR